MPKPLNIASLSAFAKLRAEKTLFSAIALIALLTGLLLPVAAVSLEAHSGLDIDLSLCRALSTADAMGEEGTPVADGPSCVCTSVCTALGCLGPFVAVSEIEFEDFGEGISAGSDLDAKLLRHTAGFRPEVRGPPVFI